MPRIGQMWPPKVMKGEHLPMRPITVMIEKVDYEQAPNNANELWWRLYLVGFPIPIMLNKTNAETISLVLQSDDTDDWIGRAITLERVSDTDRTGKKISVIRVKEMIPLEDPVQVCPPEVRAALTGGRMTGQHPGNPSRLVGSPISKQPISKDQMVGIGPAAVTAITENLKARGLTWELMLRAMKNERPELFDLAYGTDYPDIPVAIKPWVNGYLAKYARHTPGSPPSPPPPPPEPDPNEAPINEDDIPF